MQCEYCEKIFSNISSLNNHKKTAKYCLKIQNEKGFINCSKEKQNKKYTCNICFKEFIAKNSLKYHLENVCMKDFNIFKINDIIGEIIEINSKEKDKIIEKLNNENNTLKEINNIYKLDHDCIQNIAKQPKNIVNSNNKILNIITPLDFTSKELIKNTINDNYKLDYIFSGQKGIAKFAFDHLLKDEEGNLKYVCTDPSRQIFKYKDESGEVRKDVEAKKLTNFLVEGGIKDKACGIMNEWWTEETGMTNVDKFELLVDKAESLKTIDSDNTEFKKELATMTTI